MKLVQSLIVGISVTVLLFGYSFAITGVAEHDGSMAATGVILMFMGSFAAFLAGSTKI